MVFRHKYPTKNFQQREPVQLALGGPANLALDFLTLYPFADGAIDDFAPLDEEGVPLTNSYYLLYEAGIKDMRRGLREDDDQIKQRRARFVKFLHDSFNITIDPALFTTKEASYVQNNVGGVVPYSGLQKSNYRVRYATRTLLKWINKRAKRTLGGL